MGHFPHSTKLVSRIACTEHKLNSQYPAKTTKPGTVTCKSFQARMDHGQCPQPGLSCLGWQLLPSGLHQLVSIFLFITGTTRQVHLMYASAWVVLGLQVLFLSLPPQRTPYTHLPGESSLHSTERSQSCCKTLQGLFRPQHRPSAWFARSSGSVPNPIIPLS